MSKELREPFKLRLKSLRADYGIELEEHRLAYDCILTDMSNDDNVTEDLLYMVKEVKRLTDNINYYINYE